MYNVFSLSRTCAEHRSELQPAPALLSFNGQDLEGSEIHRELRHALMVVFGS